MIEIVVSDYEQRLKSDRRLPFFLALEEWVARRLPANDYLFTWQLDPTVIIGRNQNAAVEADLEYCREHGIHLGRRRSGGGCVYADRDNLMISYITTDTDVQSTFARYTSLVSGVLRDLGLDAAPSGRNDILIAGRKVSGNAFYRLPDRSIVHGTMLFSTDIDNMTRAITPSRSKLESNKVQSVQSRITTIHEHRNDITIEAFKTALFGKLCTGRFILSPSQLAEVEAIANRYCDLKWIFGRTGVLADPGKSRRIMRKVDGVGSFDITLMLNGGHIASADITGDFFLLSDLDSMLIDKIVGIDYDRDAIAGALAEVDASEVIAGLSTDAFIDLITN